LKGSAQIRDGVRQNLIGDKTAGPHLADQLLFDTTSPARSTNETCRPGFSRRLGTPFEMRCRLGSTGQSITEGGGDASARRGGLLPDMGSLGKSVNGS
jgi:hypothetical protein